MRTKTIHFANGDAVQWKWMGGLVSGTVEEIYFESISKLIKGKLIKRNGSTENPAYLVRSEAGNIALKLESELQAANVQGIGKSSKR